MEKDFNHYKNLYTDISQVVPENFKVEIKENCKYAKKTSSGYRVVDAKSIQVTMEHEESVRVSTWYFDRETGQKIGYDFDE